MTPTWRRRLRPACYPRWPDEAPLTLAALRARLAGVLAPVSAPDPFESRFHLPPAFTDWLDFLGPCSWTAHRLEWDLTLMSAARICERAAYDLELFGEEPMCREAGLWLTLGDFRKHSFFLCCDRARPEAGQIGEAVDGHPWLNGADYLSDLQPFDAWLGQLAARRQSDNCVWLIALGPDERAELDRGLRAADGLEVLISARDLIVRLSPDRANSIEGVPERIHQNGALRLPRPIVDAGLVYEDRESVIAVVSIDALEQLQLRPDQSVAPSPYSDAARERARDFAARARAIATQVLYVEEPDRTGDEYASE